MTRALLLLSLALAAAAGASLARPAGAYAAGTIAPRPRATFVATTKRRVGHHYKLSTWTNVPISRDGTLRIVASPIARLSASPAPATAAERP